MKPRFAVLRKGAEPLAMEQLERAFGKVPGMTPADAGIVCKGALGILARNFEAGQAAALQTGLEAEGVQTEVVEESRMPVLPPGFVARRLECMTEGLAIYDAINRRITVPWVEVVLIAAGRVRHATFERSHPERDPVRVRHIHLAHSIMIPFVQRDIQMQNNARESAEWVWRGEIVLAGGVKRFSLEAENFNFAGLGQRKTRDVTHDFCLLIRDLAKFAPHAALNRGATSLLAEPPEIAAYPGKRVLEDEMTWMLWWAQEKTRK